MPKLPSSWCSLPTSRRCWTGRARRGEEPSTSSAVNISEARLKHFMALLHRCISDRGNAQELELHVLRAFFDKHEKKAPFSDAEIDACIEKMSDDNKLMRSEDTIYVI